MLLLTREEKHIADKIKKLKSEAGSHSPSISTLLAHLPSIDMKVDACFLSNPYATELFLTKLQEDLLANGKLRSVLEFYPSQNRQIAASLSKVLNVPNSKIFLGNGAIEIIQAVIHSFVKKKIIINLPTFSSYYEFVKPEVEVVFHSLDKQNSFQLDVDSYIQLVKREKPDAIVLINPNNPDGGYIPLDKIQQILKELSDVETIIIDESFIHFSFEDKTYVFKSAQDLVHTYRNLVVVKSMSKDFGIAGIRAGYALMDESRVDYLLKHGYLWNVSGLAEFFFQLYSQPSFIQKYEQVRFKYVKEAQSFFNKLSELPGIFVYPSKGNFALVELLDGTVASDFCLKLLVNHGIYTRNCGDKLGLKGEFLRIAARSKAENNLIFAGIHKLLNNTSMKVNFKTQDSYYRLMS